MVRKSIRLLIEILGAVLGGLAVIGLLLGLRLSIGPWPLDFMNGYLESALTVPERGVIADIHSTELVWDKKESEIALRAENLSLRNPDGATLALFPEVTISLSLHALITGHVFPSSINLVEPSFRLIRLPDGSFEIMQGEAALPASDAAAENHYLNDFLSRFAAGEDSQVLRYLRSIEVRNGDFLYDDRKNGKQWWLPRFNLDLIRRDGKLSGLASFEIELGEKISAIDLMLETDPTSKTLQISGDFDNIDMKNLVQLAPELGGFTVIQAPVSAKLRLTTDYSMNLSAGEFTAEIGKGFLVRRDLFEQDVAIDRAVIEAHYSPPGVLELRRMAVDSDGIALNFSGNVQRQESHFDLALNATLSNLKMEKLKRYWPLGVAVNARDWVVPNIAEGEAVKATAQIKAQASGEDFFDIVLQELSGEIEFKDASVDYFHPLPKATGVSGKASFDQDIFTIETQGGQAGGVLLGKGNIVLSGLSAEDQAIRIEIDAAGDLQKALAIIESEPLRLPSRKGIRPESAAGDFSADLAFAFPLLRDLKLEQLDIKVDAALRRVYLDGAFRGFPLSRGDMKLQVTQNEMEIAGQAYLAGLPMGLLWKEDFRDVPQKQRSQYLLEADAPALAVEIFDLPAPVPFSGKAAISLDYTVAADKTSRLKMDADLKNAAIAVPELNFWKETGAQGKGRIELSFDGDRLAAMPHFNLNAKDSAISGQAIFKDPGTKLVRLAVRADTPKSKADILMQLQTDGAYSIEAKGDMLDASHLYGARGDGKESAAYRIDLSLGKLHFGGQKDLLQPQGRIVMQDGLFESLRLTAATQTKSGFADVEANIIPYPNGRRLFVKAEDAGSFFSALNLLDSVEGGRFSIEAEYPFHEKGKDWKGKLSLFDFSVINAPVMAQLLNLASLTGILENLTGSGIRFEKLLVDYGMNDDKIALKNGRMSGNSIGLTVEGDIDSRTNLLNLEGTLIPAYMVNKILGEIPIIGSILTGGGDHALFAFNYRVRGPKAQPKVSVNPLSALTPGILRDVFDGGN